MSFLPAATVEVQLFEMQAPFLGSISKFINYFSAVVLLTDLHVLGPKWVETPFQDEVPRNSTKGVVMYHYVKNTNYNLAEKKSWQNTAYFNLPIFISTPGAHRHCKRRMNLVVILCSEILRPKLVFHTAFQENYFVFPTDYNGQLTINRIFLRVISYNSWRPFHPQQTESRLAGTCVQQEKSGGTVKGRLKHYACFCTVTIKGDNRRSSFHMK